MVVPHPLASRARESVREKRQQVAELLEAIDGSRLTLSQIERRSGISATTIVGWRAGRHRPSPSSAAIIKRVLAR